jgi:hypothetical protein
LYSEDLVFTEELKRGYLLLKTVLLLYVFPMRLNFWDMPFTLGVTTVAASFQCIWGRLLSPVSLKELIKLNQTILMFWTSL